MWKLSGIIVGVIFLAIFFIQNMDHVSVHLIVSNPIKIRLTYLLLTSFVIGYVLCMVLNVARNVKRQRRDTVSSEVSHVDEDEDFEED